MLLEEFKYIFKVKKVRNYINNDLQYSSHNYDEEASDEESSDA